MTTCRLNDIDPESHRTRHCGPCDDCDIVESNQDILKEHISQDQIPLISCYEDDWCQIQLEIVHGDLLSEHTAISHVWSGGLGNFKRNGIHHCQLVKLKVAIEQLPRSSCRDLEPVLPGFTEQLVDRIGSSWRAMGRRAPRLVLA